MSFVGQYVQQRDQQIDSLAANMQSVMETQKRTNGTANQIVEQLTVSLAVMREEQARLAERTTKVQHITECHQGSVNRSGERQQYQEVVVGSLGMAAQNMQRSIETFQQHQLQEWEACRKNTQ